MIPMLGVVQWNWALDGWIVAAGILCAVAATLLGNFLVLRRMSMLGDAISHAILPGLAAAFFLSGSRSSFPMFLGAVIVGILTALFTEWIRGIGNVDEGASMGVVFTSLFALGLVMIVQAADSVDLDPGCVLYGAIELTPLDTLTVLGQEIPRAVLVLAAVALLNGLFVLFFFKELKLSSFDPELATTVGFNARLMHYVLMTLVAVTAVASFESVGNILVVAMFVVPPATALMVTDRLTMMIGLSLLVAVMAAVLGHISAVVVPTWFGYHSTTTAGMMAVSAGMLFMIAACFGPRHGILVKWTRFRLLGWQILAEDVLALLYRMTEHGNTNSPRIEQLADTLISDRWSLSIVLAWLRWRHDIERTKAPIQLTSQGRMRAVGLVRAHRLWEQYLTVHAGVEADRIHGQAARLEHFTNPELRERLDAATDAPRVDPHGSPIPAERQPDP